MTAIATATIATRTPPPGTPPPAVAPEVIAPVIKRRVWSVMRPWAIAFVLSWSIGFLHNRYVDQDEAWTISLYQTKAAKLASMPTSSRTRILLIGGSGTHFGFDAKAISDLLGRPTFNAGLDAGLGIAPICESVVNQVHEGDILVLSPEYELMSGDGVTSYLAPTFGWATGHIGVGGANVMERTQFALLGGVPGLRSLTQSVKALVSRRYSNDAYAPSSLDAFGDPSIDPPLRAIPASFTATLHPNIAAYLESFVARMHDTHVTVIIALPWRLVADRMVARDAVLALRTKLESIAPVLADPETLNLSDDVRSFTDTEYHLSTPARERRSMELAHLLEPLIATSDHEAKP